MARISAIVFMALVAFGAADGHAHNHSNATTPAPAANNTAGNSSSATTAGSAAATTAAPATSVSSGAASLGMNRMLFFVLLALAFISNAMGDGHGNHSNATATTGASNTNTTSGTSTGAASTTAAPAATAGDAVSSDAFGFAMPVGTMVAVAVTARSLA